MRRISIKFIFVLTLFSLLLAACQPAATPTAAPQPTPTEQPAEPPAPTPTDAPMDQPMLQLPEVDPGTISGDIYAAGSSTVFPLAEKIAELFKAEGFEGQGNLKIDSIGSGAGFERFCTTGETDIANASRPIRDTEVEACAAVNRTPIEFRVGTDALAVVINPQNDWATNLTIEELAKLFSSDTTRWNEVNPAWPNELIKRYSPGTDSGTFDYFVEAVMDEIYGEDVGKESILKAANIQFSEDDNVLVQGVAGDRFAIGYFGFAFFAENQDRLTDVSIEGVTPDFNTVEGGEYPLARPLFIYSDASIMQSKPQVAAFINFFLMNVNDVIEEVGYFPASAAALDGARQAWLDAMAAEVQTGVVLPDVDPGAISGDIYAAGSSTVFPLAEKIAELFKAEGFEGQGNLKIDSIGSGAGFERFCTTGETDIANASRPIRDTEVEACAAVNRTPIEFRVGTDALAVVINPQNDWATNLTIEELAKLFSSDTTRWNEVNPAWPNELIKRYSPGTDSGTFDYFVEAVMDEIYGEDVGKESILKAANIQFSEDDNVLVQGVAGDRFAIGYFGFAFFAENQDRLTDVSIEGVTPDFNTVEGGEYPLARPLFIYSDASIMQSKPQVAAFINFFLMNVNDVIEEVGYFPASAAALDGARQAWLDAMK
jgi:phosphate binding protein